ncbi:MAG: type II toxin-antitoxin system RelE/ParE family toxin [Rubrivivax sp.]
MSHWLHEAAQAELGDAAEYYAQHATRVVAEAFLNEFARVLALLELNQQLGTPKKQGLRRFPLRRFPYSVLYREDPELGPQVYAVAHQNRDPDYWHGRF